MGIGVNSSQAKVSNTTVTEFSSISGYSILYFWSPWWKQLCTNGCRKLHTVSEWCTVSVCVCVCRDIVLSME